MPRLIKSPNSGSNIVNAVTPEQGGHGEVTARDALEAMDLVSRDSIGKFGRPIPLDENGYIDQKYLQDLYASMETISGDGSIEVNQTKEYFLTGYDAFSNYDVRAVSGMVSRDRNVITYTAPDAPGQGGFTINGRMVALTVTAANTVEGIAAPVILTPVRGTSGLVGPVSVTSAPFVTDNGETHASTSWQCAEDPGFTTIVASADQSVVNKTSWSIGTVTLGKHYFIRAKYHGSAGSVSPWSEETHFTSPVPTPADRPSITSPVNGATRLPSRVTLTSSPYNTVTGDPHVSSSWQISENSLFTSIAFELTNSTVNKTSWQVSGLQPAKEYYARVRYRGQLHEYTEWSPASSFRTRLAFLPETEIGKSGSYNGVTADMDDIGGRWIVGNGSSDITGVNCAAYIYRREDGLPVLEDTVQAVAGEKTLTSTIPSGGQLTVTVAGRYNSTKSYTQAEEIIIPAGAQSLTLVGKGSSANEVTAFLVGSGSVQIPAGTTNLKLIGKGSDGATWEAYESTYWVPERIIPGEQVIVDYFRSPTNQYGTYINGRYVYCTGPDENGDWTCYTTDRTPDIVEPGHYETTQYPAGSSNGVAATMTIQGQTYTYPGGVGGPATPRTDNVTLNGTAQTLTYNIPTGGSGQYGYPGSTGISQSLVGGGEYIFPLGTPKISITAKGGDGYVQDTGFYPDFKTEEVVVSSGAVSATSGLTGHPGSISGTIVYGYSSSTYYVLHLEGIPQTIKVTYGGQNVDLYLRIDVIETHKNSVGVGSAPPSLFYDTGLPESGLWLTYTTPGGYVSRTKDSPVPTYQGHWGYAPNRLSFSGGIYNPLNDLPYMGTFHPGQVLPNGSDGGGGWQTYIVIYVDTTKVIATQGGQPTLWRDPANLPNWTGVSVIKHAAGGSVAVQGPSSNFTIQGITKTFPGGNGGPATTTTQEITLDGSDLSMDYSIPATGSGVVQYSVSTIYSNSFTGNGSHNVPADVTSVSITGRGQDGTPAITEQLAYPEKSTNALVTPYGGWSTGGNANPPNISFANPPSSVVLDQLYTAVMAAEGVTTKVVGGVERKTATYVYMDQWGGSGGLRCEYWAEKENILLPKPAKWVNPVISPIGSHWVGKLGTIRWYDDNGGYNYNAAYGLIYLEPQTAAPSEIPYSGDNNEFFTNAAVGGTYRVVDPYTGAIIDRGTFTITYTAWAFGGSFSNNYASSIKLQSVTGYGPPPGSTNVTSTISNGNSTDANWGVYYDGGHNEFRVQPTITYTFQEATPDLRTPATTGANTVVTFNGQTYTYPGGVGGPATSRNDVVNVTAGAVKPLNYTVPQGGVVSVSYTTAATPARETTAVINGQTYTFPGSSSGAASNTTFNIDLVANYNFANGVAINQDGTLAAICSSPRAANVPGYVLILQRSGTTWTIVDELKRDDGLVWNAQSVSMDKTGNYVLVGADAQPSGSTKIGSFALYRRLAGKYAVEQIVIAPDPGVAYEAGSSVSLSGNAAIAVIGAPAGGTDSRVLVYERDGNNTLVLKATLSKTTDPHSSDALGTRVYISADGSTIAASSPTSRGVNTSHANCGEVLIFRKIDNVWTQVSTVRHPTPASGLYFGQDIHLSDDGFTLSVGVPGGTGGLGEVMFFDIEGSNIVYKSNVVSSAVTGGSNFGKAIALPGHSGDLVGASKFGTYVFD